MSTRAQMNEQKNLRCARCGDTFEELRYSDLARRLLRTNEPPQSVDNNDEAALILGEMKRGHDMLASIDKHIWQAMPGSLQEKRELVQKFIDDHAVILSPFRRLHLPPEVLTEIFHFVEPVVDTDVKRGIWRLGRVCSYWRSVLLSSPSLWSTIDVQWGCVRIIQEVLSRSGNLLLDITLRDFSTPAVTTEVASSVILIVIAASRRWHRITFQRIPDPALWQLLAQLKGRVPMLVELEYNDPMFPRWLEGAPLLRKLHVNSGYIQSSTANLSWSNLRDCDVVRLTIQQEHQLLRQCPHLEIYAIHRRWMRQTDPVPSDMICLSELHTLILHRYGTTTSINFLILPYLDHVFVHARLCATGKQRFVSSLSNLLSRSQCFPTKLDIYSDDDIAVQLVSLVPLQNLTTLTVICSSEYMGFLALLRALTVQPKSSAVLLPQLKELYLCHDYSNTSMEDVGLLTEMVRSRWHPRENFGARNLAFFSFQDSFQPSSHLRGALAPLLIFRDEGLELDVDEFYLKEI